MCRESTLNSTITMQIVNYQKQWLLIVRHRLLRNYIQLWYKNIVVRLFFSSDIIDNLIIIIFNL